MEEWINNIHQYNLNIMFKDFPSLHPFAVGFPIVLILLAAGFQAALVWKDWKQIR